MLLSLHADEVRWYALSTVGTVIVGISILICARAQRPLRTAALSAAPSAAVWHHGACRQTGGEVRSAGCQKFARKGKPSPCSALHHNRSHDGFGVHRGTEK